MKSGFRRASERSVVAWFLLLLAFCMMAPAGAAGQIVIEPPSGALPDATTKVAYRQTFTASGGAAPYTFSLLQYPGGMSLSTDGVLSGAADYAGDYDVIIKVTDAAQNSLQQSYTLRVNRPSIILSPQSLPDPVWGTPYDVLVSADGGQAPYSFKATPENPLPDGLAISDAGRISGTPAVRGHFSTLLVATDANGNTGVRGFDIIVEDQPITIAPDRLPDSTSGVPYSQQLSAGGGTGSYRFDPEPGQFFDDNFALSSDGLITGTPGGQGTTTLSVRVTDSNGNVAVKRYGLTILRPTIILAPDSVASGKAGQPYQATFTATGGAAPYGFSWLGSLPNGVSLSADGVLSGTPRTDGTYEFVVRVQDADGQTGERAYSLVIAEALDISPDTFPQLQVGQPFSQALTVAGGTGSYSFSYGGALPPGMRLYAHGEFSGTPTQAGTYEFLAAAGDSTGLSGRQSYTVTVVGAQPVITLSPATVSGGKVGEAYSQMFTAEGGTAPYEFTAPGGLPAGLTLLANGTLSGTPATAGTFTFTIEAKDADGHVGAKSYDLEIAAPAITITPTSLPQAMLGAAYRQTLTAQGGSAPYDFVATGDPPPGVTLDTTGVFQGAPTVSGSFTFSVVASDANGARSDPQSYTVVVAARPDPSRDAEVLGLLEAQADAARRLGQSQRENFQGRLEALHGNEPPTETFGFVNGVSLGYRGSCEENPASGETICATAAAPKTDLGMFGADASGNEGGAAAVTLWTAGAIEVGRRDAESGRKGYDFTVSGLSAGLDYRFTPELTLGAGLGYGHDKAEVGSRNSESRSDAYTLALYGSYRPIDGLFFDALIGHQWLDFDLERHVTGDGSTAEGERDGRQWFASASLGAEFAVDEWMISPYGRFDYAEAKLDAYEEEGKSPLLLNYGDQDVETATGSLGVRLGYEMAMTAAMLMPELRLEYQHDFHDNGAVSLSYADGLGPSYRAELEGAGRDRFVLGLGATLRAEDDLALRLSYRGMFSADVESHGFNLGFEKGF